MKMEEIKSGKRTAMSADGLEVTLRTVTYGRKYYIGNYETESYMLEFDCHADDGSGSIVDRVVSKARALVGAAHSGGGTTSKEMGVTKSSDTSSGEILRTSTPSKVLLEEGSYYLGVVIKNLKSGKVTMDYVENNFTFSDELRKHLLSIV